MPANSTQHPTRWQRFTLTVSFHCAGHRGWEVVLCERWKGVQRLKIALRAGMAWYTTGRLQARVVACRLRQRCGPAVIATVFSHAPHCVNEPRQLRTSAAYGRSVTDVSVSHNVSSSCCPLPGNSVNKQPSAKTSAL